MNIKDLLASIEKIYPHLCGLLVHPSGMYKDVPVSRHMLLAMGTSLGITNEETIFLFIWDVLKSVEKFGMLKGKYDDLEGENLLFYIFKNHDERSRLKNRLQDKRRMHLRAEGWVTCCGHCS